MEVWKSVLDQVWECVVTRTGGYTGLLTVARGEESPVLSESVSLSYGARFGPDVSDVAVWEAKCLAAVDAQ